MSELNKNTGQWINNEVLISFVHSQPKWNTFLEQARLLIVLESYINSGH